MVIPYKALEVFYLFRNREKRVGTNVSDSDGERQAVVLLKPMGIVQKFSLTVTLLDRTIGLKLISLIKQKKKESWSYISR
ncbi:hypothetical protein D8Z77_21050 [Brevibacillus laterosporus]|nr:hypothetical protein D8Z77_21050 [Brevibacillus laterosporus]